MVIDCFWLWWRLCMLIEQQLVRVESAVGKISVKSFGSLLVVQFQCKLHIQLTTKQETVSEYILCAPSGSIQRYPWHEIVVYTRIEKENKKQCTEKSKFVISTPYNLHNKFNSVSKVKKYGWIFQHFAKRPTERNVQTFLHFSADSYWNLH